jgi:hypothetical protein
MKTKSTIIQGSFYGTYGNTTICNAPKVMHSEKVNCEGICSMNSCTNKIQRLSFDKFFQLDKQDYRGSIKVIEGLPSSLGFCSLLSVLANRGTSRSKYECSSPSVIALLPSRSAFPSRPFIRK